MGCFAFAAFFPLVPLSLGDRKNSFSHLFFFFVSDSILFTKKPPRGNVRFELFPPGKEKTWGH